MKIALLTTLWARPAVERAMLEHHLRLMRRAIGGVAWHAVVASSPPWTSAYAPLLNDPLVRHVEVENQPLGAKHNAALARVDADTTHVLVMGSDDFLSEDLMRALGREAKNGATHVGLLDCYFVNRLERSVLYWPGYAGTRREGEVIGAGRLIALDVIRRAGGWPPGLAKGLDAGLRDNLRAAKQPRARAATMTELGGKLLCTKGSVNIWGWRAYKGSGVDYDTVCREAGVVLPNE